MELRACPIPECHSWDRPPSLPVLRISTFPCKYRAFFQVDVMGTLIKTDSSTGVWREAQNGTSLPPPQASLCGQDLRTNDSRPATLCPRLQSTGQSSCGDVVTPCCDRGQSPALGFQDVYLNTMFFQKVRDHFANSQGISYSETSY